MAKLNLMGEVLECDCGSVSFKVLASEETYSGDENRLLLLGLECEGCEAVFNTHTMRLDN